MKLGIYVGSFNPPHKGHIHVVNYLLHKKIIDKVLIIPTGAYWNKQDLAPLKDRINMLKFYETTNIKVDTENNKYPYTYELMQELSKKYPKSDLYLIMSADNIINFDKWKNYQELLKYKIIIMNRGNIDIKSYTNKYPQGNFVILQEFDNINISSSEIRKNLDNEFLDNEVFYYIKENHLYEN